MVVKGTKKMCPACEMARWGLGYDDTTFNSMANTKRMVTFSAQQQAELQVQEGMLLLSLHQILQHCLRNFPTTGLALFPSNDYCNWM